MQPFLGEWHLPLTPLDQANQPPLWFLQVQDVMNLALSLFWTVAFALYARQAFVDKSYGAPLLTLVCNIGWDSAFGIFRASRTGFGAVSGPWVVLQVATIYAAIKYGPAEWKHNKHVADNLYWALPLGVCVTAGFYVALIDSFENLQDVLYGSFVLNQIITSGGGLAHLFEKGNTKGHSLTIWFFRAIGSFLTFAVVEFQRYHYPADHPVPALAASQYAALVCELMDVIYPFAYLYIDRMDKSRNQTKKAITGK
jgi:paspaline synthase